jgi:hypothetical protein
MLVVPGGGSILGKIQNIMEADIFANFRKNRGWGYESNSFHENLHSNKGHDVRVSNQVLL